MVLRNLYFVFIIWIISSIAVEFGSSNKQDNCKTCGIAYGTTKAKIAKYPWLVGLAMRGSSKFICSGVIISPRFILTAGHCVDIEKYRKHQSCRKSPLPKNCTIAERNLEVAILFNKSDPILKLRDVRRIITHPKLSIETGANDIALLELKNVLKCEDVIMPICLPAENIAEVGETLLHAKWIRHARRRLMVPAFRKQGKIKLVEKGKCRQPKAKERHILCGVTKSKKQLPCMVESGASLMKKVDKEHFAVGIMSMGAEGCGKNKPDTFTDIYPYMSWIMEHVDSERTEASTIKPAITADSTVPEGPVEESTTIEAGSEDTTPDSPEPSTTPQADGTDPENSDGTEDPTSDGASTVDSAEPDA